MGGGHHGPDMLAANKDPGPRKRKGRTAQGPTPQRLTAFPSMGWIPQRTPPPSSSSIPDNAMTRPLTRSVEKQRAIIL